MPNPTLEQQLREKIPTLDYKITDDFISVFDGVFPAEYCQNWINHFNKVDEVGKTYSRMQAFDRPSHMNKDQAFDMPNFGMYIQDELKIECNDFVTGFWNVCYPLYAQKYSVLQTYDPHKIYVTKIQKTVPGGGYHIWHSENSSRHYCSRVLVFILYLNDVEEGGETEFLYLSKRIQPKTGRLLLWPSGFTHTHRGNPPLKGDKYIITGWVEL